MNPTTVMFFVTLAVALAAPRAAPNQYTNKYDSVNIEEIIHNKRLLEPYLRCVLEEGKCSPEGRELKSHIKEALETYCNKCTEAQQRGTRLVIAHLINNEPKSWVKLTAKYDPSRKYVVRYETELRQVKAQG